MPAVRRWQFDSRWHLTQIHLSPSVRLVCMMLMAKRLKWSHILTFHLVCRHLIGSLYYGSGHRLAFVCTEPHKQRRNADLHPCPPPVVLKHVVSALEVEKTVQAHSSRSLLATLPLRKLVTETIVMCATLHLTWRDSYYWLIFYVEDVVIFFHFLKEFVNQTAGSFIEPLWWRFGSNNGLANKVNNCMARVSLQRVICPKTVIKFLTICGTCCVPRAPPVLHFLIWPAA